jgi:hypothetical protein
MSWRFLSPRRACSQQVAYNSKDIIEIREKLALPEPVRAL